jgi:hypothetical protein
LADSAGPAEVKEVKEVKELKETLDALSVAARPEFLVRVNHGNRIDRGGL